MAAQKKLTLEKTQALLYVTVSRNPALHGKMPWSAFTKWGRLLAIGSGK